MMAALDRRGSAPQVKYETPRVTEHLCVVKGEKLKVVSGFESHLSGDATGETGAGSKPTG